MAKYLTKKEKKFVIIKATGETGKGAVLKSFPNMKPKSAEVYANRLMKKEKVKNELSILKELFRDRFMTKAFENWDMVLNKLPEGKLNWANWIEVNRRTFELAGLKEEQNKTEITKKIEFIKQYKLKE